MRHSHDFYSYNKKKRRQEWNREHRAGGFRCSHCKYWVVIDGQMGTVHRNHCNVCLWSKHVDESKGDRMATCLGRMRPIGLTFKQEGAAKQGEIMLVHECASCPKLSINRIARDDDEEQILGVFSRSLKSAHYVPHSIELLDSSDEAEIRLQLFGSV